MEGSVPKVLALHTLGIVDAVTGKKPSPRAFRSLSNASHPRLEGKWKTRASHGIR